MRLTTLARKINKTPSQLITFLDEKGVIISNGLHTKLEDSVINMVIKEYLPEEELNIPIPHETEVSSNPDVIEELNPEKKELTEIETINKISAKEEKEEIQEITIQQKTGTLDDLEEGNLKDIELIKVKKVKLEGIKVVGKIELPEKPKKEDKTSGVGTDEDKENKNTETNAEPVKRAKSRPRKFDKHRKRQPHGRNRKPLTYEEKLKEEERKKLKKRRQKEKEDKLRKKQYYVKNIQPKATQKLKNKKKNKQDEAKFPKQEKVVVHKNPLKRLWAWLNGKYDSY